VILKVLKESVFLEVELYEQNGGMVNGSNLSRSHFITSSAVLSAFADRNGGGTNSDKGRGEETQNRTMLKLENIILELFEGSKVAEMLNAWEIFNPSAPVDIPYQSRYSLSVCVCVYVYV
jgi:hypothetical protein